MNDNLAKLRQCLLLLSSEHDGEVVAAARAINRQLGSSGKDWHWLVNSIGAGEPDGWEERVREAYELGRQSVQRNGAPQHNSSWEDAGDDLFVDCQDAAEWLLDNHGARLREKDCDFLNTMMGWRGEPTRPQAKWLNDLCRRYGYRP